MNLNWWKVGTQKRLRTARGPSRGPRARVTDGRLTLTRLEDRTVPDAVGISLANGGATTPNAESSQPSISSDGGLVAFASAGTNLVAGQTDANAATDIFLYDRNAGTTVLVSHTSGSATTAANAGSFDPVISGDGRFVVFQSDSTNLVAGSTDANATSDVFLYNVASGAITLISHTAGSATTTANAISFPATISLNGNFVAFASGATNLVAGQTDTNANLDVFRYNTTTGATTLVSHSAASLTTAANAFSENPAGANDGTVAFDSAATNLVTGQTDTNAATDVFAAFGAGTTVTLLSHATGAATTAGNGFSQKPVVGSDGTVVAFESAATNLVAGQTDANGGVDVFRSTGGTADAVLVSHTAASATTAGNGASDVAVDQPPPVPVSISADGRFLVYVSAATDLVAGQTDTNAALDVFLFDGNTGTNFLISHTAASATAAGNAQSADPSISRDGSVVAFDSTATDLVTGASDANAASDVFQIRNPTTGGATALLSSIRGTSTTTGNGASFAPTVSPDGTTVVFASNATNLSANDTNGVADLFASPLLTSPHIIQAAYFAVATGQSSLATSPATTINVYDAATGTLVNSIVPFGSRYKLGANVAVGDVNGDGFQDIVISARRGADPIVFVYSGAPADGMFPGGTPRKLKSFYPYYNSFHPDNQGKGFNGGVFVAVGDVNGDGFDDIVTGAGAADGGAPHVRVFSGSGLGGVSATDPTSQSGVLFNFFADFAKGFNGGVRVAAGDLGGDGRTAEVVCAAGPGGAAHVIVYSRVLPGDPPVGTGKMTRLGQFFAFPNNYTGGSNVAVGALTDNRDATGLLYGDILVAKSDGPPEVRVFRLLDAFAPVTNANGTITPPNYIFTADLSDATTTPNVDFTANFGSKFQGGASVAAFHAGPVTSTTTEFDPVNLLVGAGPSGGPAVYTFGGTPLNDGQQVTSLPTLTTPHSFFAFDMAFNGGAIVGGE
jgi:Tol biopolymer transport system component